VTGQTLGYAEHSF